MLIQRNLDASVCSPSVVWLRRWKHSLRRIPIYLAILLLELVSARATSVVVRVAGTHITIAADDLATRMYASNPGPYAACKIVPLGKAAFAVAGNIDYQKNDPADTVASWDARDDAQQAFFHHPSDLPATAEEWAENAVLHYSSFLTAQPARVHELASGNQQHVLVLGTFAGWNAKHSATVIFEWIYLDLASGPAIRSKRFILPARQLPYTTNATTQDLIEGNSQRSVEVLANWQAVSMNFRSTERDWRWLEFLIQTTSDYDHTVGREVNVLDLTPNQSPNWLQNFTCGDAATRQTQLIGGH